MKLFELIDPKIGSTDSTEEVITKAIGEKPRELGKGAFGVVYEKPDDPGVVRKVHSPIESDKLHLDPYLEYVKHIAKYRKSTGNPYLPKIYSVEFEKTGRGIQYMVEMERLNGFEDYIMDEYDPDDRSGQGVNEQVIAIGERMFHGFEDAYSHLDDASATVKRIVGTLHLHMGITDSMYVDYSNKLKIRDRKLAEALVIIRKIKNNVNKSFFDIHSENIMFRRTPYGLQLVLTDPLASWEVEQ